MKRNIFAAGLVLIMCMLLFQTGTIAQKNSTQDQKQKAVSEKKQEKIEIQHIDELGIQEALKGLEALSLT